jgi:hypothetical protein
VDRAHLERREEPAMNDPSYRQRIVVDPEILAGKPRSKEPADAEVRRESTPSLRSLADLREAIAQGEPFADDSTELIRESRRERTEQVMRAVGWSPARRS